MRQLLPGVLAIVLSTTASATTQPPVSDIWISITASNAASGSASVRALNSEMYVEGSSAGIGVERRAGGNMLFTIKAWKEADQARVVVYARLEDTRAPGGFTETPISTFRIAPGAAIDVAESEKWDGPRLLTLIRSQRPAGDRTSPSRALAPSFSEPRWMLGSGADPRERHARAACEQRSTAPRV